MPRKARNTYSITIALKEYFTIEVEGENEQEARDHVDHLLNVQGTDALTETGEADLSIESIQRTKTRIN
jgi:hypothetical protein